MHRPMIKLQSIQQSPQNVSDAKKKKKDPALKLKKDIEIFLANNNSGIYEENSEKYYGYKDAYSKIRSDINEDQILNFDLSVHQKLKP